MSAVFEARAFDNHEEVVFVRDPAARLQAIIAVHSTRRGPATGGCRLWRYKSSADAQEDVLRLSSGMTFKNAMADLPLGGGKAVILAPEGPFDRQVLFESFGDAVERLAGRYVTAEDVGVTPEDLGHVATRSRHVAGLSLGAHASGDPSPVTARGVFECLLVGAEHVFGATDLSNRSVAIQGLGHVGWHLASRLADAGATLIVSDLAKDRQERAVRELGATVFTGDDIRTASVDILCPCALGGLLTVQSAPHVTARLICGAANNQLATPEAAQALHAAGIVYLPDYVVNAGGVINVASEILRIDEESWVDGKVSNLSVTIAGVLDRAARRNVSPAIVADETALERVGA